MGWNEQDFVLSADAQFNGCRKEWIRNLEEYVAEFDDFASQYQVVLSPELHRIISTFRRHEPMDSKWEIATIRHFDEHIVGYPMEFYQSQLQKPFFYIDFRGRIQEFSQIVRSSAAQLNALFDRVFQDLYSEPGADIDRLIEQHARSYFHGLDSEMLGILIGYLRQKPRRMVLLFDIEAVNPDSGHILKQPRWYFDWLEAPYQEIKNSLMNFGIEPLTVCSGKGYHILSVVPLGDGRGGYSSAMLRLMAIGGIIQGETLDKMCTTRYGSTRINPCPILTQRAYQGVNKLLQFVTVNVMDNIRHRLSAMGMPPWVSITDNYPQQISIDLTGGTRQVEMGCFGSVASVYNKRWDNLIIRIPRARGREEFFNNDIGWMLETRGDMAAAKPHLIHTGGWIPENNDGINRLIEAYEHSRIKKELHDPCEQLLDPDVISGLIQYNYGDVRTRIPSINEHLDNAQPAFLTPSNLDFVYHEMATAGYSIDDMRHLTYAVYCDNVKHVEIDPKYSKAEWCRWPILLMGELFKG